MDPLHRHIATRRFQTAARFCGWLQTLRTVPAPLRQLIERKIWPFNLRHMRAMADGICFERMENESWEMNKRGAVLTRSIPFHQLVGLVERPVSIVASGPSAADYPWDEVRNGERFIIAVNGSPTFLNQLGIRPDLLVVTDSEFMFAGSHHLITAPDVPLVTTCRAASILGSKSRTDFLRRKFSIIERVNAWYGVPALDFGRLADLNSLSGSPFDFPLLDPCKYKVGWSRLPELGFFSGGTVVFAALQVVIGLGARDIEIIGMDLNGNGRSYAEGTDAPPSFLEAQYKGYILPSFKIMQRALVGTDIRIRNLSPVCPLPREVFNFD